MLAGSGAGPDQRAPDQQRDKARASAQPSRRAQVLHGDYTLVNVLFDGDRLSAVVDFRPPDPFLTAYELGRIAFNPDAIVTDPAWFAGSREILLGYLDSCPGVRPGDVLGCGRVALIQLLRSVYGVKEHYLGPGLFQADLDRFWLRRHRSVRVLLDHLPEIDAMLAEIAPD